jgi:hypothetical protein
VTDRESRVTAATVRRLDRPAHLERESTCCSRGSELHGVGGASAREAESWRSGGRRRNAGPKIVARPESCGHTVYDGRKWPSSAAGRPKRTGGARRAARRRMSSCGGRVGARPGVWRAAKAGQRRRASSSRVGARGAVLKSLTVRGSVFGAKEK